MEDSEHANALRQCSPFVGITTEDERIRYLRDRRPPDTPSPPCGLDIEAALDGSDGSMKAGLVPARTCWKITHDTDDAIDAVVVRSTH